MVLGYNAGNDHIISVRFCRQPLNMAVIQVYFPTTDADNEVVDEFGRRQQQDVLLAFRDWNDIFGNSNQETILGFNGSGTRNEAGKRFINFCQASDFYIASYFLIGYTI